MVESAARTADTGRRATIGVRTAELDSGRTGGGRRLTRRQQPKPGEQHDVSDARDEQPVQHVERTVERRPDLVVREHADERDTQAVRQRGDGDAPTTRSATRRQVPSRVHVRRAAVRAPATATR